MTVELSQWDTDWWGFPVVHAGSLAGLSRWAQTADSGCGFLLLNASEVEAATVAVGNGARLTDVRIELDRPTSAYLPAMTIATDTDLDALARIARHAFRGTTRFYADPGFPDERCDDLYENWLRESYADPDTTVILAQDAAGPTGFVTVQLAGETSKIGLIAVKHPGKRLGKLLCVDALAWAYMNGAKTMSVVTQGRNISALRAFQAAGFRHVSTGLWIHKWATP
jgi:hypothetical protein